MSNIKHIHITDKHDCCGCGACLTICPHQCISFNTDWEGSWYPYVDSTNCNNCGACARVCPILNKENIPFDLPVLYYAAYTNNDEIRYDSSSGGLFYTLAQYVIEKGGIVFGARFDGVNVIHDYTDSLEGINAFMGSKYVQSDTRECYKQAKDFLEQGRYVLFSGTLCHLAALRAVLRKNYEQLIQVEILCHGVPSPKIWKSYLKYQTRALDVDTIEQIKFRAKDHGWNSYDFFKMQYESRGEKKTVLQNTSENLYFTSYFDNWIMRPSCYSCTFRKVDSLSDFTIGDHWEYRKTAMDIFDNKGLSSLVVRTPKAHAILNELQRKLVVKQLPLSAFQERVADQSVRIAEPPQYRKLLLLTAILLPFNYIRIFVYHWSISKLLKKAITKPLRKVLR